MPKQKTQKLFDLPEGGRFYFTKENKVILQGFGFVVTKKTNESVSIAVAGWDGGAVSKSRTTTTNYSIAKITKVTTKGVHYTA